MVPDILRDSTFGQLTNWASKGRIFPYPEERPGYNAPSKYIHGPGSPPASDSRGSQDDSTMVEQEGVIQQGSKDVEKGEKQKEENKEAEKYPWLVEWDGPDDPDNPRNWSTRKKNFVAVLIGLLTFSVYIGSAIYTPSIPSLEEYFGVSQTVGTLGLTLFVLAYGLGPMIISPVQENPAIGRSPPYIIGLFLFVLFQMPELLAKNIWTIMIFRFGSGFVGSPALATGGASLGDMYDYHVLPYALSVWSVGAVLGPVFGPVIGGFAAMNNGWRWPFFELLWISGFALLVLFFCLPETLDDKILYHRAKRLRKVTGNEKLKAQCELDDTGESLIVDVGKRIRYGILLSMEPAVAFGNVYIALVYAIFYLWFEAFPLVFQDIYGMNLGLSDLPYLGFIVSGAITLFFYILYQKYHMIPRIMKNPELPPEARLELGIVAGCIVPISLFMFGWTSRASVHWMAPVVGAALYLPGVYLIFQCIILYIAQSYPKYQASILAGNAFFRSTFAAFFPLFGAHFYHVLGIGDLEDWVSQMIKAMRMSTARPMAPATHRTEEVDEPLAEG
ncbi:MFS transporter, DHA1 family, multidrug resistance protein [Pseudohyphozyma bogoriensis]|nr:MFS transporter, DHA1 family, multidrug resistance protein [Pseudohyphozyma bogoriensis]